ncbi:MAG: tRNA preQ1(34) S-adenosylmethionine ribosyltransferase-isomerase QueA [Candidatus Auribacterota bacterium]|nr:tRNA preQ1(34) S-adenosylmethionine ribosyltransferase-isomerase QueA [Candidatus Auribacterota bacterium]
MKTSEFDYYLPPELIAQHPPERREDARLMVLDRGTGGVENRQFPELLEYLSRGDLLVLNNARVIPARLYGHRIPTGGKSEILLLSPAPDGGWNALVRPARRARPGTEIDFGGGIVGVVRERLAGKIVIDFPGIDDLLSALEEIGYMPLPPYIKRDPNNYPRELRRIDRERYQTVFSRKPGAIAAPTAGLHFTDEFLETIREKGVTIVYITLYVGYGTFQPVKTENLEEHRMHEEYYEIDRETAGVINQFRERKPKKGEGGCLWLVGTTTVRALESAADLEGRIKPTTGPTDIFIYPGYRFKFDFSLITNFHLPKSTLIMLVSALAGRENILNAYKEAIKSKYRFFSYGDAMLIL